MKLKRIALLIVTALLLTAGLQSDKGTTIVNHATALDDSGFVSRQELDLEAIDTKEYLELSRNLLVDNKEADKVDTPDDSDENEPIDEVKEVKVEEKPEEEIEEEVQLGPIRSNEEIAKEVLAGKWSNGSERKEKLTEAGYSYSEIQAEVEKLSPKPSQAKPSQTKPSGNQAVTAIPAYSVGFPGQQHRKLFNHVGLTHEEAYGSDYTAWNAKVDKISQSIDAGHLVVWGAYQLDNYNGKTTIISAHNPGAFSFMNTLRQGSVFSVSDVNGAVRQYKVSMHTAGESPDFPDGKHVTHYIMTGGHEDAVIIQFCINGINNFFYGRPIN